MPKLQDSTHYRIFSYGNKKEGRVRLAVDQKKLSPWLTLLVIKNRWTNSWLKTDRHKQEGSGQKSRGWKWIPELKVKGKPITQSSTSQIMAINDNDS